MEMLSNCKERTEKLVNTYLLIVLSARNCNCMIKTIVEDEDMCVTFKTQPPTPKKNYKGTKFIRNPQIHILNQVNSYSKHQKCVPD